MKFLWDPYGHSYGSPAGFLWVSYRVSMICFLDFYAISMGFLLYWIPKGFFLIFMRFLWNLYGISMVLLRDVFAIAIGFLLDSCGISMICL